MENDGKKPGDILADYRYDTDFVREKQSEGRTHWLMQYQMVADLGDSDRYPLRLSDFIVSNVHPTEAPTKIVWGTNNGKGGTTHLPDIRSLGFGDDCFYGPIMFNDEWQTYTGTKMAVDPAGRGADKLAYAIISHLAGMLWVHDVDGLDGGYSQANLEKLAQIARQYHVREMIVEDNFGQGMFAELMRPVLLKHKIDPGRDPQRPQGWVCGLDTVRATGQKEVRLLEALEPSMGQHRLVIDYKVARNEALQHQITRIRRERNCLEHDDEIDALATCVAQWRAELEVDPDRSAESYHQRKLREAMEEARRTWQFGDPKDANGGPRWFAHR
jgi:hypothetical protein